MSHAQFYALKRLIVYTVRDLIHTRFDMDIVFKKSCFDFDLLEYNLVKFIKPFLFIQNNIAFIGAFTKYVIRKKVVPF